MGTNTGQFTGYFGTVPYWVGGVTWNETTNAYTRTDSLSSYSLSTSPGDAYLPIHAQIKRCLFSDAGVVQYYTYPTNTALKADGVTPSVLTGADGQVMVEIPAFYYLYSYSSPTHTWKISQYPLLGYSLHPAFVKNGSNVAYRYIGAYEGILYDVSGSAYTNGGSTQVRDFVNDKLSSVSGFIPVSGTAPSNGTRAQFRTIASNRGTGWRQLDFDLASAIQLLYLVEYASFQTQAVIGAGITNVTDWAAYNGSYGIAPSGNSNVIGNATGNTAGSTSCAVEATKYLSYRGIENWYGHLTKWVDGINVNTGRAYVTNNASNWADDTAVNYTDIGIDMAKSSNYQATLLQQSRGFLPATVGADTGKIGDYYYYDSSWRVVDSGGSASYGSLAGGFCLYAYDASSAAYSFIAGRVCF